MLRLKVCATTARWSIQLWRYPAPGIEIFVSFSSISRCSIIQVGHSPLNSFKYTLLVYKFVDLFMLPLFRWLTSPNSLISFSVLFPSSLNPFHSQYFLSLIFPVLYHSPSLPHSSLSSDLFLVFWFPQLLQVEYTKLESIPRSAMRETSHCTCLLVPGWCHSVYILLFLQIYIQISLLSTAW